VYKVEKGILKGKKRLMLIIAVALVAIITWVYLLALRPLLFSAAGGAGEIVSPDPALAVKAVKDEMAPEARSAGYAFTTRENRGEINVTPGPYKGTIVELKGHDARWIVFYGENAGYTVMCLNESAETLTPGCGYYLAPEKPPAEKGELAGELTDERKREIWDAAMVYRSSIKYNDPNRLQKMKDTEKVIAKRYRLNEADVAEVLAEGRRKDWPKP
jgi:hypothetical protein